MDEVQSDEELCLPGRQLPDRVQIPHFLEEGVAHELLKSLRNFDGTTQEEPDTIVPIDGLVYRAVT
jgi:hypothetical protein